MANDYLIEKKPIKALLLFALPIIIGNFFQKTYTMADSAIVGRFVSEGALAAIGACDALTNIFICIAVGGGIGASVIVSRSFGSKEYVGMREAVNTALLAFLGVSILLGAVGLLLIRSIMVALHTPGDVLDMAEEYLRIYFIGLPFLFMYNVISSMFNALGKSRIPLAFLIFSSVFNVGLDLLLVIRFDLGIAGVAWATLIAQGISAALSFAVLISEMRRFGEEKVRLFDPDSFFAMTNIALPSILQQSTVAIGIAGAVGRQQLRLRGAGRLLGSNEDRGNVLRSADGCCQCNEFLYRAEYRSRKARTREGGLPCGKSVYCCVRSDHRRNYRDFYDGDNFNVPRRGWDRSGAEYRLCISVLLRLGVRRTRSEAGRRRAPARRGRYKDVHDCKSCESVYKSFCRKYICAALWDRVRMVRCAGRLVCKLADLLYAVP